MSVTKEDTVMEIYSIDRKRGTNNTHRNARNAYIRFMDCDKVYNLKTVS